MSLELTGACMSGTDAVKFLEFLPDVIPEEALTDEFCEEYERMLNRVRYEVSRSVPVPPKFEITKNRALGTLYYCGECGHGLRTDIYKRCPRCGRVIKW